jgi:hypothetical protein
MDFIQNNALSFEVLQKGFGVRHHAPDSGQLAIEILYPGDHPAQASFTDSAHT